MTNITLIAVRALCLTQIGLPASAGCIDYDCGINARTSSASQVHAISDRQRSEARGVVERYWTGSHTERYSLLTENYRERLERLDIRDAEMYANQVQHPERVWKKRTYQRINVTFQKGRLVAQVAVLAQWEQEGYEGVITYIFDLVQEGNAWKIDFIMH